MQKLCSRLPKLFADLGRTRRGGSRVCFFSLTVQESPSENWIGLSVFDRYVLKLFDLPPSFVKSLQDTSFRVTLKVEIA